MKVKNFDINVIVEHGYTHYKVVDMENGIEVHCDANELNDIIEELLMENIL